MATPNLGLTQYLSTQQIHFLTDYNGDMGKIDTTTGKLSNLTTTNKTNLVSAINENVTNIGTLSSLKTAVKTSTVNAINEVYDSTDNGWINTRATLTYSSTSGQNFVCSTNIDLTSRISVGMKIKLTQTTTKYFFVTAITSNSITLYGGATYSVISATISNVYYSIVEAPYGFPIASTGLGVDFIVENGSNANGKFTKCESGKIEMWGTIADRTIIAGSTDITFTLPHQILHTYPACVSTMGRPNASASGYYFISQGFLEGGSPYLTGYVSVMSAVSQNFIKAGFHAIGSWK
jgi:hypothetical protein